MSKRARGIEAIIAGLAGGANSLGQSMNRREGERSAAERALRQIAMQDEMHKANLGKLNAETMKLLQAPQAPRPPQTLNPGEGVLQPDGTYKVQIPKVEQASSEPLVAIVGPDGKPKLVRRSQAEGAAPYQTPRETGPARIPAAAVEKEIGVDNMISQTVAVQQALASAVKNNVNATGRLGGVISTPNWVKNAAGMGGEAGSKTRQAIGSLKATIAKERAGTSMTPGELDLLQSYVPHENEDEAEALRKVNGFLRALQQIKKNRAAAYARYGYGEKGRDAPPPDDDLPNREY